MRATLRPARRDDGDFLTWTILTASRSHVPRGVWEYLFDFSETTTRRLLGAIVTSDRPHWCHWSAFHVAEVSGEPAAALCAFDPRTDGMHVLKPMVEAAAARCGIRPADEPGIDARGAVLNSVVPDYADGAWVVENVATAPPFRRCGLIDALIQRVLGIGRSRGYARAQIAVFIDNTPAERAYLKNGFEIESEMRSASMQAALGFPGLRRLLRAL
jgi:ribosomal protein S18 acetylase RimI-like enzyme